MIELLNVYKSYNKEKTYVLKNLSIKIDAGDMVAIIGKSGVGKTTLLNVLGSLDVMQKGSYIFYNKNVEKMSTKELYSFRNNNIGFVFQEFHLIPYLTVLDNILIPVMHLKREHRKQKEEKALSILEEMEMLDLKNRLASKLSGGEKQRVAIARSLINNPKLILADEPTGNLDKENEKNIFNELKKINETNKVTVLIVTHNEDIIKRCNKIFRLEDGELFKL